uniref:cell division protein ZipA n=1 Tax=Thaumasiovibrio occultus TaxID=1891184 RepID=UPI000B35D804|nr:cell division protein ZipA [Thaumasiovibrio occultus]
MQELRLVLIMVGVLAIAALLLHGLWTSRKEQPAKFGEKPLRKMSDRDREGFDEDGVGQVRVVSGTQSTERKEPEMSFGGSLERDPLLEPSQDQVAQATAASPIAAEAPIQQADPALHFSATDQQPVNDAQAAPQQATVEPQAQPIVEPQQTAQPQQVQPVQAAVAQPVAPAPQMTEPQSAVPQSAEVASPAVTEPAVQTAAEPVVEAPAPEAEPEEREPEVLVLHVHASRGETFRGLRLLQAMESHGLQFGDMNIYHRHADDAPEKVIFSVANSVNPGVFYQGAEFETPGISLFMMLPCFGRADQNFKLMLQTAQQIADDMGGLVLDQQRNMITPHKLDEYRERIKAYQLGQG